VRPGLGRGVAADDVKPDAELQRPAVCGSAAAQAGEPLGDLGGCLAPGQIGVDVLRGNLFRRSGRATEEALTQVTTRLKFLVAFRPGFISPTLAARTTCRWG
jgi:hypothetical protein